MITNTAVTIDQFATNSPTSWGHANASSVIAVGAANALTIPPSLESYSSVGGVPILFDNAGQPIAPQTRQTPDVVGPDNVNTTFFGTDSPSDGDTFPNFAGTSAAAPHVAGLLGLLRQANPTATPAQLLSALTASASDMGTVGYDYQSGYGLANGLDAEYSLYVPPQAPDLTLNSDNGLSSTDNVTSLTTLTFTGSAPAGSHVSLYDGGLVASQQLAAGATSYSLTVNTSANTVHGFSVQVKSSAASSSYSALSPVLPVYVDSLATSAPSTAPDLTSASDTGVSNTDNLTVDTTPTFTGTAAAGAYVTLWIDGVCQANQQLGAGVTAYNVTSAALAAGTHSAVVRAQMVPSAPSGSYYSSPSSSFTLDDGAPPTATITVSPQVNSPPSEPIQVTFNKPVVGVDVADFSLTRNGGANRFPGTATITSPDSQTFTIRHFNDVTMAAGGYALALNYASSGVLSVAGLVAAAGTDPVSTWSQGSGATGFQNAARYYDVNNDTYVTPLDALQVINALNSPYSGQLPGGPYVTPPPYLDVSGDSFLTPMDALRVINFLNAYGIGGPFLRPGGDDSPPPTVDVRDVTARVELEIVDSIGTPVSTLRVGDQFELRGRLIVNGPAGVQPFAAFVDVGFTAGLIAFSDSLTDWRRQLNVIDEAGGILYDREAFESADEMFRQTFVAMKQGSVTFTSDAADLLGHEILVTGLDEPLALSQITFGSITLGIEAEDHV